MSENNADPLFAPPVHIATDIHAESDRLTERLLRIEAFMGTLPWKLDVSIDLVWPLAKLRFARRSDGWHLLWVSGDSVSLVKDCGVAARARVAEALPSLLKEMRSQFDERAVKLKEGHVALDQLEQELAVVEPMSVPASTKREGA